MITDSFGSPSLGQGIALQVQPKDYSGQIVKGIVAGQERKAKAEQKKLDADLKKQVEQDEALSKFKLPEGRFRAFDRERLSLTKQWYDKVIELKNQQKPIKNNLELKQLEWELQNKFDKIRELEDRYAKGYDEIATPGNKDKIKPLEKKIKALDNEQEYLQLVPEGGDIYSSIGNLYEVIPDYNYLAKSKKIGDNLSAQITTSINEAIVGKMDGAKKTQTKEYLINQVNEAWNMLKAEPDYQYQIQQAIATNPNLKVDEYEKTLETVFKSRFNKQITEAFQQAYQGGGGGTSISQAVTVTPGIFTKDVPVKERAASVYEAQLQDIKNYFTDPSYEKKVIDDKGNEKVYKYNPEVAAKIGIDKNTPLQDIPALIDAYNQLSDTKKYGTGIQVMSVDRLEKEAQKAFKDDKNAKYVAAKDRKANKEFELVAENGKTIYAVPQGITKVGGKYKFIVDERRAPGYYVTKTIPLENNAARLAKDWLTVEITNAEQGWIDLYEGKSTEKKEQGGLVEPKEIFKKFHDKSRNMTKFVYSDGSEEIFKGLL